ncbi:MAG: MBL fold metallo-hydrolase [Pseudomonadota bacterium]
MSEFDPSYGEAVRLGPQIVRVTAENPGPFTGAGTNTFLLGENQLMVVDPGPADPAHTAALVRAIAGRPVSHILITHTHLDHVGGLGDFRAAVDAPTAGEGAYREARPLKPGEENPFRSSSDVTFQPDIVLRDGDTLNNGDVSVTVIATPGHTANHICFTIGKDCLVGDHVMGWSTTVVAPPDGSMGGYLRSLDRLARDNHTRLLPTHGDVIDEPQKAVSAVRSHRLMRERAIAERLALGDKRIGDIVDALYENIDTRLKFAAGLSVLAHLEKLEDDGRAKSQGWGVDALWEPTPAFTA